MRGIVIFVPEIMVPGSTPLPELGDLEVMDTLTFGSWQVSFGVSLVFENRGSVKTIRRHSHVALSTDACDVYLRSIGSKRIPFFSAHES